MVRVICLQCDLVQLFDSDIFLFGHLLQLNRHIVRMIHLIDHSMQPIDGWAFVRSYTQNLNYGLFMRMHF